MRAALVRGVIERRLLVAYRLDPDAAQAILPAPFRTRLISGYAVAGIALARLGRLRPAVLPSVGGLTRESATHGIAVEWESASALHTGIYVLHRDSAAPAAGPHSGAGLRRRLSRAPEFRVDERTDGLRVAYTSRDQTVRVDVDVALAASLAGSALFADVHAAARFFELDDAGAAAWEPAGRGLRLTARDRCLGAAYIRNAESSVFSDASVFPPGSAHLDSALLLREVAVAWAPVERVRVPRRAAASLA